MQGGRANGDFDRRCALLLTDLGLCDAEADIEIRRLSGGVASDIAAVTCAGRTFCLKFALAKLAVAEDWFAPVHRSRAEFAWLSFAGSVVPGCAPALYGFSEAQNGFAMEFLSGADIHLWKQALLEGAPDRGEAQAVGDTLGRIHAASTEPDFDTAPFENAEDFDALRLEPYLRFTATRHPALAEHLTEMAIWLKESRIALVHGDVSPKNILVRAGRPVLLDAECASMGDPAFDVAFCLNHLVLKAYHMPDRREALLGQVSALWSAYSPHVEWERAAGLESRIAMLLPMLMLARIDGKSPVEYLDDAARGRVRGQACALIERPPESLGEVKDRLS